MRFSGKVGYGEQTEIRPGVHDDVITERVYYGDVLRNSSQFQPGESVNNDVSVTNTISIVADAYANGHIFAIRYVEWSGTLWEVSNVEIQSPRLLLRLGGVYNGPRPEAP